MSTLIIYDDNGTIYSSPITGSYTKPVGELHYIEIEIPVGQRVVSIDATKTPNVPIFEDIPKTEVESMQEQLLATQAELADLKEQLLLKQ